MDGNVCYEGKDHEGGCEKPCEGCPSYGIDRRVGDRRKKSPVLKLIERRKGFDRRRNHLKNRSAYSKLFSSSVLYLKDRYHALIILLIVFNLLNVADFVFTLKALAAGFAEANPIMNNLFMANPQIAGVFKITTILFVSLLIWFFRKYRLVLEVSVVFLVIYMALISYHIYNAIMYY